jgi:hypothetical protein
MTTKIELRSVKQAPKGTLSRLIWVTPLAVAAATLANLGLYAGAGILFPEVTAWSGAGPGQIVGANIVYLLIGAIVFAVIARLSSRPARHYLIVATIGLLLSLGLPISAGFGSPPAGAATVITLNLMHVVSFAISVPLFNRLALD